MIAEFYIIPESFACNGILPDELEKKIRNLSEDCFEHIRNHKDENRIFVHSDIYYVNIFEDITVYQFIYDPEKTNERFDHDTRKALRNIIEKTATTDRTLEYVKNNLLNAHNADICYGLISFTKIKKIQPEYLIIYDLQNWYKFRRYFLGLYPGNATYYIEECKKYFINLFFHEQNKETIKAIFSGYTKKIIEHLSALNDTLPECLKKEKQLQVVLKMLTSMAHLDEEASLEGNINRKTKLTFIFVNSDRKPEGVYCEAHLKLCYNDNYPSDKSYGTDGRIYFHPGKVNIQNGKILIGHIGRHL
jgi:hypothetical protein